MSSNSSLQVNLQSQKALLTTNHKLPEPCNMSGPLLHIFCTEAQPQRTGAFWNPDSHAYPQGGGKGAAGGNAFQYPGAGRQDSTPAHQGGVHPAANLGGSLHSSPRRSREEERQPSIGAESISSSLDLPLR